MALTSGLFDAVPLEQMPQAESAVQAASSDLPKDLLARFETEPKLSDADRKVLADLAGTALAPFLPQEKP